MRNLDGIRDRERAATNGPWDSDFDGRLNVRGDENRVCWTTEDSRVIAWRSDEDLEFVAHARTDIPRLLAALDAVHALCWMADEMHGDLSKDQVREAITRALEGGIV